MDGGRGLRCGGRRCGSGVRAHQLDRGDLDAVVHPVVDPQRAVLHGDPLVHDRISGRLSHFLLDAGAVVRQRTAAWRTPTLIMWGEDDRCVDPAGSAAFAAAAPQACVSARPWPGLAHEIFNEVEQDQVLQALSDWLAHVFAG